jgi:fucose permease
MSTTLRYPFVWVMAFFLLATCGYETTTGGWIVTYMLKVRGADIDKAGYIASGFWGGELLPHPPYSRLWYNA